MILSLLKGAFVLVGIVALYLVLTIPVGGTFILHEVVTNMGGSEWIVYAILLGLLILLLAGALACILAVKWEQDEEEDIEEEKMKAHFDEGESGF